MLNRQTFIDNLRRFSNSTESPIMHHIWDALQGMKNAGIYPGPSAIAQKDVLS